jgi:NADPH:quinone reductase
LKELTTDPLASGYVRVKVFSAPVNPSDYLHAAGVYGIKSLFKSQEEMGVGFEGAGEVVELGPDVDASFLNARVAFAFNVHEADYEGSWRELTTLHTSKLIRYPDHVSFDDISSSFVNPLTVCGFIDTCQKNSVTSIIQDASASALGRMLNRLAKDNGITVINIVRKEEQVKILKDMEVDIIVNSSLDSFWNDLDILINTHKPKFYFSAIGGGEFPGTVLEHMPARSTAYIYGVLTNDKFSYHPGNFIFK